MQWDLLMVVLLYISTLIVIGLSRIKIMFQTIHELHISSFLIFYIIYIPSFQITGLFWGGRGYLIRLKTLKELYGHDKTD